MRAVDLHSRATAQRAIEAMQAAGCEPWQVADGADRRPTPMQIHLVDATYELFRAHYAPRPAVLGRDGVVLSGVSGLCDQLLFLLREEGATHVGCATDRVIESFRNDLFPGYKSSAGMPRDLLDQFPIAEEAIEALGARSSGRWSSSRRTTRSPRPPAGSPPTRRSSGS